MQCYCGKLFYQVNAFNNHQGHCKTTQKQLTAVLSKAQQIWSKKREAQRLKKLAGDSQENCDSETPAPQGIVGPSTHVDDSNPLEVDLPEADHDVVVPKSTVC